MRLDGRCNDVPVPLGPNDVPQGGPITLTPNDVVQGVEPAATPNDVAQGDPGCECCMPDDCRPCETWPPDHLDVDLLGLIGPCLLYTSDAADERSSVDL